MQGENQPKSALTKEQKQIITNAFVSGKLSLDMLDVLDELDPDLTPKPMALTVIRSVRDSIWQNPFMDTEDQQYLDNCLQVVSLFVSMTKE